MPISLKLHNVNTYKRVNERFEKSNKVAIIHPTGTGKMFIALKFLEENKGKRALYVAPSISILHDVKKNIYAEGMTMNDFPKLKRITYQKLMRLTDEEMEKLSVDIIVLDEFHHCGAPEWGKGVERLLQKNEGAKILGLSATPLRYLDGLRDMSDELFENNVASEMTLEEAIEKEILPEASYISTLNGYDEQIEEMQTNIDKITDNYKREEAQRLLNSLKSKLDENTKNLPNLLSKHMHNKSGKYIIFCRNIDDMNEKIEQAQKIFGKVNPNITIRAVSSKIRESDKVLTQFEQDNEEETLKLLYAVDMINEGYHIRDLDGVVMMRPTFSPTVFTQQLGRALTVGRDKKPVIIDLVNNFDSCKIIADFAERMRKYKGNAGNGKKENPERSRISIFDKTKEFREIAEKITNLSKRKIVSLEQKIEIFEKFARTGEKILGNTIFEGYPLGQWAIQIRSYANNGRINFSQEQFERLEKTGILERQIDSTLDEKIDALVEWRKKYPQITIIPIVNEKKLKEYAKTDEEYKKIKEEYEKMQRYYAYVRARSTQGKLGKEQFLKCKEGDVRGIFGYPNKFLELAQRYKITEKDVEYILNNYGTIDYFFQMHKLRKTESKKVKEREETIILDVIDVDGSSNRGYDLLWKKLNGNVSERIFYSSEALNKLMNELLTDREKIILEMRLGLVEGENSLEEIAKKIGVTRERIRQIEAKAIRKLRSRRKSE